MAASGAGTGRWGDYGESCGTRRSLLCPARSSRRRKLDDGFNDPLFPKANGAYTIPSVLAGMYSVMAEKEGYSQVVVFVTRDRGRRKPLQPISRWYPATIGPISERPCRAASGERFAKTYWDDWNDRGAKRPGSLSIAAMLRPSQTRLSRSRCGLMEALTKSGSRTRWCHR